MSACRMPMSAYAKGRLTCRHAAGRPRRVRAVEVLQWNFHHNFYHGKREEFMTVVYEDYRPIDVGDTGKPFAPLFQMIDPTSGQLVPFPLTGVTISMKMKEQESGVLKVCSGPWTIDDALGGKAHYAWQSTDVDTAGIWLIQVACTNGAGQVVHADVKVLSIQAIF